MQNDTTPSPISGVYRRVLAQHGEAFAQVKRLGMRSEAKRAAELGRGAKGGGGSAHEEMVEGYAALRTVVASAQLLESDARASDLADAMAALDAINPGSPEWGPTFLQVSELVEAHLHAAEGAISTSGEEYPRLAAS